MFKFHRLLIALFLTLCLSVLISPAIAQEKTLVWERYDTEITIRADGTLLVAENQEIAFLNGTFTEGFAVIPLQNVDRVYNILVLEDGIPYTAAEYGDNTYSVSQSGYELEVVWRFLPATSETRRFTIQYEVEGAVAIYPAGSELSPGDRISWWGVPNQLAASVNNASVTVNLPSGARIVEEPEAESTVRVQVDGSSDLNKVTFLTLGELPPYEGVNIRVTFTPGIVTSPKPAWQAVVDSDIEKELYKRQWGWIYNLVGCIGGLLGALLGGFGVYGWWRMKGKDPQIGPLPTYIASLPSDLPPALAGSLMDERTDQRDITSTLFHLARRGYIELEEQTETSALGTTSNKYIFHRTAKPADDLLAYEKTLLNAFFSGGKTSVDSSVAMPYEFFGALKKVEDQIWDEIKTRNLINQKPRSNQGCYNLGCFGLVGLSGLLGLFLLGYFADVSDFIFLLAAPLAVLGIGLQIIAPHMAAKSQAGALESGKWWAFKTFLENIDKYSDIKEVANRFDEFLPYAIAFGVDRKYVHFFSQVPDMPSPGWYRPVIIPRPYHQPASGGVGGAQPINTGGIGKVPIGTAPNGGLVGGVNSIGRAVTNSINQTGRLFTPSIPAGSGSMIAGRSSGGSSYRGGRSFSGGGSSFRGGGGGGRSSGGGGSRGFR
jgi:uncharacterized membrane protein